MRKIRRRISYANVVSALAIVVALGTGTVWAANQLAPKSVGTKQLKTGAVTADKLRKNAVTDTKIKDGAIGSSKIASGAVTSTKIAAGSVTGAKIVNGSVTPEKIPDDSLTGQKIDEATLSRVPNAAKANTATFADASNPEAFALVTKEGSVVAASSKGIGAGDVNTAGTGIYCIGVPGFSPRGAQATPEKTIKPELPEQTLDKKVSVFVKLGTPTSCPSSQIEVRTYNEGALKDEPFYFMAYR
jgi:hypothetical protein